jgi:hypothetical protein
MSPSLLLHNSFARACFATLLSSALASTALAQFQVWNAGEDFSPTNNPNSPWAYGTRASADGSSFLLLPDQLTVGPVALWYDQATTVLGTPAIGKNMSPDVYQLGSVTWLAGDFTMHPGRNDAGARRFAVTRWTSPITGRFLVSGAFIPADSGSTDVHVVINGITAFTAIRPGSGSVGFEFIRELTTGDTVDFVVGNNDDFQFDTTVVDANLTFRPPCDSIDFNADSLFPDDQDLIDFLSVLAGGACSTNTCSDIDFNNDGLFPDDNDLLAFLTVLAGGNC